MLLVRISARKEVLPALDVGFFGTTERTFEKATERLATASPHSNEGIVSFGKNINTLTTAMITPEII
tara:strand:- start:126 stop:326 length:201 start_codon:yes stop_codon:yes gene_type:complete